MNFPIAATRDRDTETFGRAGELRPEGRRWRAPLFDVADLEQSLGNAECIQLEPGHFSGTWMCAQCGPWTVYQQTCNRGVQIRKAVSPDRAIIGFVRRGGVIREHARVWTPEITLAACGADLNFSTLGASQIIWLEFRPDALGQQGRSILSRGGSFPALLDLPNGTGRETLAIYLLAMLNAEPPPLRNGGTLTTLVDRALHAAGIAGVEAKRNRQSFLLAQRVVLFMWENVDQHLTLESICERVHCGMRRLIYSFTDSFGMGPMRYLKILRLNAVRRRLKDAHGDVRILDVAGDFGFWHMGHFSADYKRMFGTTATETIEISRDLSSVNSVVPAPSRRLLEVL